jgi:hypothetical protein
VQDFRSIQQYAGSQFKKDGKKSISFFRNRGIKADTGIGDYGIGYIIIVHRGFAHRTTRNDVIETCNLRYAGAYVIMNQVSNLYP